MSSPALLIGIGNAYRSDDGVGLVVIRAVQAKGLPETFCIESNGDGAALIDAWANAGKVILIDAVSSGAKPGTHCISFRRVFSFMVSRGRISPLEPVFRQKWRKQGARL
jgi:hydrogenase maturation protease